ncbi:hypothetical protein Sjap_009370 [Stephania japonica]|uniref:Disease resistance protein n=1 Tax=Stephania japonica TaxID=461633 RepID=A0AAP0PFD6_9MAGN
MLTSFTMLRKLDINYTNAAAVTMLETSKVTSLTSLAISEVPDLTQIPSGFLSNNKLLERLEIGNCTALQSFPTEELKCLTALEELRLGGLSETLDSFNFLPAPDEEKAGHQLSSLKTLQLYNSSIHLYPNKFNTSPHLKNCTYIVRCSSVKALPDWQGNLPSLRQLHLKVCPELMQLPSLKAMQRHTTLQKLSIQQFDQLEPECEDDQGEEWDKISHIPWVS